MHLRIEEGGSFTYRIPTNPERNVCWMEVLCRIDCFFSEHARICSRHFRDDDFLLVKGKRKLKKDAIPSLCLSEADENKLVNAITAKCTAVRRLPFRDVRNTYYDTRREYASGNICTRSDFGSDNTVGVIQARLEQDLLAGAGDDPVIFQPNLEAGLNQMPLANGRRIL
ncbi:uncharacterized protein LOC134215944 [Armigeres subalbatus]|uniref:uncharacterized protein LOC134215944 n=1 Tax=Armigeres subalbatus TaxID=124917 RepID=UPI002ED4FE12